MERRYAATPERDVDFTTLSDVLVQPLVGPHNYTVDAERVGYPGVCPSIRGVYPSMYRGKPWTIRQFPGFGSVEDTNQRYHDLLAAGQHGLSVAFDMPTLMGRDSDEPESEGEVGHCGVAVGTIEDMERRFQGVPLGVITTSMTINGPAVVLFAMYCGRGRQGFDIGQLAGTLQTDIHKEYIAQEGVAVSAGAAPEPHRRVRQVPRPGREQVRPRLSCFFGSHIDFFEEIASSARGGASGRAG